MLRVRGSLRSGRRSGWPAKPHFRPAISIDATRDRRFFPRLAVPPFLNPQGYPRVPEFHVSSALSGPPSSPRTRPDRGRTLRPVMAPGEVAEWSNAPHSKCGIGASLSGVRIPPSPPISSSPNLQFWAFKLAVSRVDAPTEAILMSVRSPVGFRGRWAFRSSPEGPCRADPAATTTPRTRLRGFGCDLPDDKIAEGVPHNRLSSGFQVFRQRIEMARHELTLSGQAQLRLFRPAAVEHEGTSGVEAAAAGWIDRARHVAFQDRSGCGRRPAPAPARPRAAPWCRDAAAR